MSIGSYEVNFSMIMKKKIGVVPKEKFGDSSTSNMVDYYYLGNNYVKRITEAGGLPIGIAASDGWVAEELLDLCDGFLVQGGQAVNGLGIGHTHTLLLG